MKRDGRRFRSDSSGQLLIVAALAIAVTISATTFYVYELGKETNSVYAVSVSDFTFAVKQSIRNTMISSLANISNGGEKAVLTTNLNEFSQVLMNLTRYGICQLDFTVLNDLTYDSGVWLSWDTSDLGVSSAYANFSLKVYSLTSNMTVEYAANITTTLTVNGYYTRLVGNEKLVNLTCKVYNEREPALAKNLTFFYEYGSWMSVDSSNNLSIVDYGNGTCTASFTLEVPSNNLPISVHMYDLRDIFVQANMTCYEG